jgi:hypothetical protein
MRLWTAGAVLALCCSSVAIGGKKDAVDIGHAANDRIDIQATPIVDRNAIKSQLGTDFDGSMTLVQITVTPKGKDPLAVRLDDFLLRSERDGKRSGPFAPTQLAGQGGMVLHAMEVVRSGPLGDNGGPIWGGSPGATTTGQARRGPGNQGAAGNSAAVSNTDAKVADAKNDKPNPLLAILKAKVMPEKNTTQPVSGLLCFPLEKQRPKDLELDYNGPAGPLKVRFQ